MDTTGMVTIGFVAGVLGWMGYLNYAARAAVGRSVRYLRERIPGLDGREPALVYCFSPRCGPCRSMTPVVEQLQQETGRVFKFDVSQDPELAVKMGIRATPTILVIAAGEVREVLVGAQSAARLRQLLEAAG